MLQRLAEGEEVVDSDLEAEIQAEQELELQAVHLAGGHAAHLGVVCVVEVTARR